MLSPFESSRCQQPDDPQSTDVAFGTGIVNERARGFAIGLDGWGLLNNVRERGADLSKFDLAGAISQKTIMPNPHQAFR